jgi:hypothetical protein
MNEIGIQVRAPIIPLPVMAGELLETSDYPLLQRQCCRLREVVYIQAFSPEYIACLRGEIGKELFYYGLWVPFTERIEEIALRPERRNTTLIAFNFL